MQQLPTTELDHLARTIDRLRLLRLRNGAQSESKSLVFSQTNVTSPAQFLRNWAEPTESFLGGPVDYLRPGSIVSSEAIAWSRFEIPSERRGFNYNKGAQFTPAFVPTKRRPSDPELAIYASWADAQKADRSIVTRNRNVRQIDWAVLPGLWIEVDCGDLGAQLSEIKRASEFIGAPFGVVFSGSKSLHAFWRFDRPIVCDGSEIINDFKRLETKLLASLGGDLRVGNPGREMRSPSFLCADSERIQPTIFFSPSQILTWADATEGIDRLYTATFGASVDVAELTKLDNAINHLKSYRKRLTELADAGDGSALEWSEQVRSVTAQSARDLRFAYGPEAIDYLSETKRGLLTAIPALTSAHGQTAQPGQIVTVAPVANGVAEVDAQTLARLQTGKNDCPVCGHVRSVSPPSSEHRDPFCHACGLHFVSSPATAPATTEPVTSAPRIPSGIDSRVASGDIGEFGWILSECNAWENVNIIQTPCGSGKSEAMRRYIGARLSSNPNLRCLWVVARRALASEAHQALIPFGFQNYLTEEKNPRVRSRLNAENTRLFVCCIDSLWRLGSVPAYDVIVIDEDSEVLSKYGFRQATHSRGLKPDIGAVRLYEGLAILAKHLWTARSESRTIFCCDAVHTRAQLKLIRALSEDRPVLWTAPATVKPLASRRITRFSFNRLLPLLLRFIAKDEPFVLYTLTKGLSQVIAYVLRCIDKRLNGRKTERIQCFTADNHMIGRAGNDTDGAWKDSFAIVYNGSISSGISYKGSRFKHAVAIVADYGLSTEGADEGVQNGARSIIQALQRARGAEHYWICAQTAEQNGLDSARSWRYWADELRAHYRARLNLPDRRRYHVTARSEVLRGRPAREASAIRTAFDSDGQIPRLFGLARQAIEQDKIDLIRRAIAYLRGLGAQYEPVTIEPVAWAREFDLLDLASQIRSEQINLALDCTLQRSEESARSEIEQIIRDNLETIEDYLHFVAPDLRAGACDAKRERLGKMGYKNEPPANPAYVTALGVYCHDDRSRRRLQRESLSEIAYEGDLLSPLPVRTPLDVARYTAELLTAIEPRARDYIGELLDLSIEITDPGVRIKPARIACSDWARPVARLDRLNRLRRLGMLKPLTKDGLTRHARSYLDRFLPSCIEWRQRSHAWEARINYNAIAALFEACLPSFNAFFRYEVKAIPASDVTLIEPESNGAGAVVRLRAEIEQTVKPVAEVVTGDEADDVTGDDGAPESTSEPVAWEADDGDEPAPESTSEPGQIEGETEERTGYLDGASETSDALSIKPPRMD